MIKTEIIKSLTEKYQLVAPVFLQNEHPISEFNISLANNKKKVIPKLKNSAVKKTLILKDSITKNVDGWKLNRRMKSMVSVRSISGATTKAMKHYVMGCLEDGSPDLLLHITILLHHGTSDIRSEESAERLSLQKILKKMFMFQVNSKK